jgi:outer membrane protein assembly factor BamB
MEELLQLHVVTPKEIQDDISFDDVHDLIWGYFAVPNKDVPSYDHLGTTVSSSLFERRPDNITHINEIESQISEWFPNASVFKSSYEQTFDEFRSTADPDRHILILVTNYGVERPTIRWKREKETLQAPPLVLGDEIFHANHDGIFAMDSATGEVLWESDCGSVIQVPVGNNNKIIGNTGPGIVALDRASGEVQWRTEVEPSGHKIINTRVALGADNAYVGFDTGEVMAFSLDTGDSTVLCECADSVVRVQVIEPGLIVWTGGPWREDMEVYLVDSSGKTVWPEDAGVVPRIEHSQDDRLYANAGGSLLAMSEDDGAVEWQVDFPNVNDIVQIDDTLCVSIERGLIGVDAQTGDRVWEVNEFATESATVSNPVAVSGVVACVSSDRTPGYTFDQNILHIFDPTDGTELQRFELGVGDCYGPSAVDDSIVCSAGGELICIENLPATA